MQSSPGHKIIYLYIDFMLLPYNFTSRLFFDSIPVCPISQVGVIQTSILILTSQPLSFLIFCSLIFHWLISTSLFRFSSTIWCEFAEEEIFANYIQLCSSQKFTYNEDSGFLQEAKCSQRKVLPKFQSSVFKQNENEWMRWMNENEWET